VPLLCSWLRHGCCRRRRPPGVEHCVGHLRPRLPLGLHPAMAQDAFRLPLVQSRGVRLLLVLFAPVCGVLGAGSVIRPISCAASLCAVGVQQNRAHCGRLRQCGIDMPDKGQQVIAPFCFLLVT
jgi:hypothetical protein